MANKQCPNCKQFTFSENIGAIPAGIFLIIGSFIIPLMIEGGAEYHGGHTDVGMTFLILITLGVIVLLKGIFFPSKTIKFSCSNCKYEEEYLKK
jgi:hypothetical protein